jgi:hypothetical protein
LVKNRRAKLGQEGKEHRQLSKVEKIGVSDTSPDATGPKFRPNAADDPPNKSLTSLVQMTQTVVPPWDTGAFDVDDKATFALLTWAKACASCNCAETSRFWLDTVSMLTASGEWCDSKVRSFMGMGSRSWDRLKAVTGLDIPKSSTGPSKKQRVEVLSDKVGKDADEREVALVWFVEGLLEEKTQVEQRARQAEAQLVQRSKDLEVQKKLVVEGCEKLATAKVAKSEEAEMWRKEAESLRTLMAGWGGKRMPQKPKRRLW